MLKIYNTLHHTKEEFTPLNPKCATCYCCGPTVYNYAHIGNLRTYIFEDLLMRTIRHRMPLKHMMNITDVGHLTSDADAGEDKMALASAREGKSAWDIAKFYEKKFFEDFDSLNCRRPDIVARATEHIPAMINLVKTLENKGYTYKTGDGIYYDTSKFADYGILMNKAHLEGLKTGARVDFGDKKNATDFALWKFSPTDAKRQMEWDSPWGVGFPGWHIECSAMAMQYLGETLDIHCGGIDHVAIHHTNEIAQAQAATGKQYVRYWIHGEFLVMSAGKMSKSAGTFVTIDTLKEKGYDPLDYRYLCLGAHYRTQLEFSYDSLDFAKASRKGLKAKISALKQEAAAAKQAESQELQEAKDNFVAAMEDDLNTAKALALLWDFVKGKAGAFEKIQFVNFADNFLGLNLLAEEKREIPAEAKKLLEERAEARKQKDFKKSDELRAKLLAMGIVVKDTPRGQEY